MAKKKKSFSTDTEDISNKSFGLKEETLFTIYGIACLFLSLFFILAYFDKAGIAGEYTKEFIDALFGIGYILLPLVLIMQSISFFKSIKNKFSILQLMGSLIFLLGSLGLIHTFIRGEAGLIGKFVSNPLLKFIDFYATVILLSALIVISFIVVFNTHIRLDFITNQIRALFAKKDKTNNAIDQAVSNLDKIEDSKETELTPRAEMRPVIQKSKEIKKIEEKKENSEEYEPSAFLEAKKFSNKPYNPPPLSLLEKDRGKPGVGDIKANANMIQRTLQNFGITVEMDEISIGPSVTRYALKPAEGVKVSRIAALQNDLALALAAHPLRIEAPIPGKSLVGIEIPNTSKTTIGLASLLSEDEFIKSNKPLTIALGKGVSGKSHFANLAKAPHLLIAGSTGAGKSVTIHAILTSLIYRNSPEQLKFIMIDPKRVELTMYNSIPHLKSPVITDPKKAIKALTWAATEMARRYDLFEQKKVRDIESYHKNILLPELEKLQKNKKEDLDPSEIPDKVPYIVIVIDELADIMQTYPRELEAGIVRLAQMSRAVGIHLILSTQRPSVNVITGLIKANIPSRIALRVTSQIDSRTILDMAGAEKLLGAGDMLFVSGDSPQPTRIQSAFISETELKDVVNYLIENYADEIPETGINLDGAINTADKNIFSATLDSDSEEDDKKDALYEEAQKIAAEKGFISTSYLQRRISVGYSRAAKIIDQLERDGLVGPQTSKGREYLGEKQSPTNEDAETVDESLDNVDNTENNPQ